MDALEESLYKLEPFTFNVINSVDLSKESIPKAKQLYREEWFKAFRVIERHLSLDINWKIYFSFYLPANLTMKELESEVRKGL